MSSFSLIKLISDFSDFQIAQLDQIFSSGTAAPAVVIALGNLNRSQRVYHLKPWLPISDPLSFPIQVGGGASSRSSFSQTVLVENSPF